MKEVGYNGAKSNKQRKDEKSGANRWYSSEKKGGLGHLEVPGPLSMRTPS
jgi:hypothetical protein